MAVRMIFDVITYIDIKMLDDLIDKRKDVCNQLTTHGLRFIRE